MNMDIERNRLKWYAHVKHMSAEQIQKNILQTKPRGKPRTRWLDQIMEDIKDRGPTWTEIWRPFQK